MSRKLYIAFLLLAFNTVYSQADYDECVTAFEIEDPRSFCGQFTTNEATSSNYDIPDCWPDNPDQNKDIWLTFRSVGYAANIVITSAQSPRIEFYRGRCASTLLGERCTLSGNGSRVKLLETGLTPGTNYLIRIATNGDAPFRVCVDNYNPPVVPGQDCGTGAILCDKSPFVIQDLLGSGNLPDEAAGSCLAPGGVASESNSSWLKWTCDTPGNLEFTITPLNTGDDIDFALFALGSSINDCGNKSLMRCNATAWQGPTGINTESLDTEELAGENPGDDRFVKEIQMNSGESYALLINNFTQSGAGIRIEFFGSSTFLGPKPDFIIDPLEGLKCDQTFTVKDSTVETPGISITNYTWSFGEESTVISTADPNVGPFGIDYVSFGEKSIALTVTSDKGCVVTKIKDIDVLPCCEDLPPLDVEIVEQINPSCIGEEDGLLTFEASNGRPDYQYSLNGSVFDFFPTYPNLGADDFDLQVVDSKGCTGTVNVSLNFPVPVEVDAGNDQEIELGDSIRFDGSYDSPTSTNLNTVWSPAEGINNVNQLNSWVTPPGQTTFRLTVFDEFGCEYFDEVTINTINIKGIFAPNIIKQDAGDNGIFTIQARKSARSINQLLIYDRWGNLMYQTQNVPIGDTSFGWDGTFNGQLLNPGVYTWLVEVEYFDNTTENVTGTVTLIR